LITLRRNIYQSMLQAFYHGRFIANPFNGSFELGPDLDLVPKVNDAYETMMQEDEKKPRPHRHCPSEFSAQRDLFLL